MKHKRSVILFFIITILIISVLPILNFDRFMKKYDYKELYNTDIVEKYTNYAAYKIFNISLEKEKVISGKDDFFFLGNKYGQIIDKTQGLYNYKDKDLKQWVDKLKIVQDWYENRGMEFVIVIAPNKHSIYREMLPSWIKSTKNSVTDNIVKLSNKRSINILDLRDKLKQSKDKYKNNLYYKVDTHWNGFGASVGFNETINYLNKKYNQNYIIPKYTYKNSKSTKSELSDFLKISDLLVNNDQDISFDFGIKSYICLGEIDIKTHLVDTCSVSENHKKSIVRNPLYISNKKPINKEKVLFICDSFLSNQSMLYNATFSEQWKFHYRHVDYEKLPGFIDVHKPDIAIYQLAERDLYSKSLVSGLSMLSEIKKLDFKKFQYSKKKIFDIHNSNNLYKSNNKFTFKDKILNVTGNDPRIILNGLKSNLKYVLLNYKIDSPKSSVFQFFYKKNIDDNYNSGDSYGVKLNKGINEVSFLLPSKYINNELRVDFVDSIGSYKIEEFSVYETNLSDNYLKH